MKLFGALCLTAVLTLALSFQIHRHFKFPYPPFNELIWDVSRDFSDRITMEKPLGSEGGFRDFGGVLLGMRRMTADVAWLSVLQYYGSHAMESQGLNAEKIGEHPALKKLVLRVVKMDPYFHFAVLYGAGSLAFNLGRFDEATEILQEGIKYNPTFWQFRLYVAAIVWKQKGRYDNLIPLLEQAVTYKDCPTLIKTCLANIHKARGNYALSIPIWLDVLESEKTDPTYRHQAAEQIEDLQKRLGIVVK